jgi:hypothetical protein
MKTSYRFTFTGRRKSRKQKKVAKSIASASIAQRYMELRRLRERLSEAESRRNTR